VSGLGLRVVCVLYTLHLIALLLSSGFYSGTTMVYQYLGDDWVNTANLTGSDIDFSMSEDGYTIGIASRIGNINPSTNQTFHRYNGTDWVEEVCSIVAETDHFVCTLSSNGSTMVCGRMYQGYFAYDGDDVGTATVYQFKSQ